MNNTRSGRTQGIESLEDRTLFSSITVAPVVVTAGVAPQLATFTAVLDAPSATPITLSYKTMSGTAIGGFDYKGAVSHIVIQPGQTSATFSIKVFPDTVFEPNRIFFVNLKVNGGNTVTAQTSATIIENNVEPSVVVSDAVDSIGRLPITKAKFWVGLSGRSATPITVNYQTEPVTAVAGVDYLPGGGSLVIPAYKTGAYIKLDLIGTAVVVPDKVFDVNITSAAGAVVSSGLFSRIVIQDHGGGQIVRPNMTISSPQSVGGNAVNFVFTLSAASTNDVSFRYAALPVSARANQFTAVTGIFTIPAGQTTATISVPTVTNLTSGVNVDTQVRMAISGLANAQLATKDPIGTILAFPTIVISDDTVDETGASPSLLPATFFVTLNAPSTLPVTVTYNTANGTGDPTVTTQTDPAAASAGLDYTATSGTLTFQPGQTSLSFTVPTLANNLNVQDTEEYTVNLSGAVNGIIGRQTGLAMINNIAFAVGEPMISISDPTFTVANGATGFLNFTISLADPASVPVSVHFTTEDGTGAAGTDYTAKSGTVTFAPGQTNINVPVQVFGASPVAVDRTVLMVLSSPVNGKIVTGLGTGTGTITELGIPQISINSPAITVANGSSATLNFDVTLDQAATVPVTVNYTTSNGTGIAGTDYTATSGTVTFLVGQTDEQIPVTVFGASSTTAMKTVVVTLSNPAHGAVVTGTGTGTITETGLPQISINSPMVTVANGNMATLNFNITLAAAATAPVTVNFATSNGTGVAGTDYTATSGSVTFTVGQTSKLVPVTVFGASLTAVTNTVLMTLSMPVNGLIVTGVGTGSINETP